MAPVKKHIYRLEQVLEITGLGSDTIYRLAREGRFPKQIKLSERASGWISTDIEQWIEQRIEASRNEQKAA